AVRLNDIVVPIRNRRTEMGGRNMVFEDRTQHNESSSYTQAAEPPANNNYGAAESPHITSAEPQSIPAQSPAENSSRPGLGPMINEKEMTEDFATALETFTAEQSAEAAASEDRALKGTVVKVTSTHVVVDAG